MMRDNRKSRRVLRSMEIAIVVLTLGLIFSVRAPRAEGGERRADADSVSTALPRDPALRTGTLANGMRYYVRANKTPSKRALLYLAVNAGSVQEDDDQRGFAHFLEHMAFNGTRHFPRHQLLSTLQLAGMRFGADINAQTSFDETIYQLEVPTDDGKSVAQGLTMLEDWAGGGMLIDSSEVLAERGVVLGEWRSRLPDTAAQSSRAHQDSALFGPDSRYTLRSPIGLTKLLQTAEPGPVRRFYHEWYRPDLMAVVAVGDFDPVRIEHEIVRRFGAIASPAHERPRVSPHLPTSTQPVVDVFQGSVAPGISVLWKQAPEIVDSKEKFRHALTEQLLLDGLQRRLQALSVKPRRPFISAEIGRSDLPARESAAFILNVVGWPTDSLEGGLATSLSEIERVAQHGISDDVLARQKAALLRQLESNAVEDSATPSHAYVDGYVQHFLRGGGGLFDARQELALAREILPKISSPDIAAIARFWRTGANRLTLVNFPKYAHERTPSAASVNAIFDSVAKLTFPLEPSVSVAEAPLLAKAPTAGKVVSERESAKSGITEWTLSNGARVLFKPLWSDPDQLLVRAVSLGGSSLLPDSLFFSPGRMVDRMMTQAAGLGTHDRQSLQDKLESSVVREFQVEITPTSETIALGGSPKDLETLFQMMYLQFTSPKLDTAALNAWKQAGSPNGFSADDQLNALLSNGNPRLMPSAWTMMPLADTGRAMAVYRDRFGNAGDFTFIIVGAAKPAQLRPLVERYLASLPSTEKREQAKSLDVRPWERMVRQTARVFDVPKASTNLLFDGEFPTSPEEYITERRRLDALAWTLRLKFTDDLREQMGGTYGVGVQGWTLAVPQEHYRFAINFDAAPERMGGMLDTMFMILDSVRAKGATAEELKMVEAMQLRNRETELQDDRYWLRAIELFDRLKIPLDWIAKPPLRHVTAQEIAATARKFLPTDAFIHLTSMPQDSTSYTVVDSTSSVPPDSAISTPQGGSPRLRVVRPSAHVAAPRRE